MPAAAAAVCAGHRRNHRAVRADQHRQRRRRPAAAGRRSRPNHSLGGGPASQPHQQGPLLPARPRRFRPDPDHGATAPPLAPAAGSLATVRLLLERGADIEARDTAWNTPALDWAIVGSGMRLGHDPDPDWAATVSALLDTGASTDG